MFDDNRIPILLHADDPIFLASSLGELQRVINIALDWAMRHKVSFHVSSAKTVVQKTAVGSADNVVPNRNVHVPAAGASLPRVIAWSIVHKWLGLPWPSLLDWVKLAERKIASATAVVSSLQGLLDRFVAPICIVLQLFSLKVNSSLRFGRWLWSVSPGVPALLEEAYRSWARMLLGADRWRNWAICFGELGWKFSGSASAVLEVALRRQYFWSQANQTLAGTMFVKAHSLPGATWAKQSLDLLSSWGLDDYPIWKLRSTGAGGYAVYLCNVLEAKCLEIWQAEASRHTRPFPLPAVVSDTRTLFRGSFGWNVLIAQRSLIRLRCGFVRCGHLHGAMSQAQSVQCFACNKFTRSPVFHILLYCSHFEETRDNLRKLGLCVDSANYVSTNPNHPAFPALAEFAFDLDKLAMNFWRGRR